MSLTPAMIDALLAAGGTAEQLAALVKADLADKDARKEAKRANNAERQRRYRERHSNESNALHGVTERDSVTDPALSRPPNENNSNPPTHTHPDMTSRARKGGVFPMLDCADEATWADFLTNRAKKRLPNTASAHRKLETDLAAMAVRTGWPPGEVFAACVAKGWGAIYDPRDSENGRSGLHPANDRTSVRGSRPNPALDMVLAAERELQAEAFGQGPGADWAARPALPPH